MTHPEDTLEIPYVGAISGLAAGDPIVSAIEAGRELIVNLRAVDFADPAGILALATACIDARLYGCDVTVLPPFSSDVANYLLRMRVRDVLAAHGISFEGSFAERSVSANPLPGRLLEFQVVRRRDADRIARELRALGRAVGIPAEVIARAYTGVEETLENVFEHSQMDEAFAIAQRYVDRSRRSVRLEFAVGDVGVGLRRTLEGRYDVRSDEAAVRRAIREGVSRYRAGRRGDGLYWTVQAAITAGGLFHLRSGTARIRVATDQEPLVTRLGVDRDGVQISLSLRSRTG